MGTRVIECRNCKHLFQSFGSGICPTCTDELEKNFEIVKEYIYNNPGANVIEIAKGTGVPEKTVLYYLREGRLSIEDMGAGLVCEKCKKPVSNGRFCKECQATLESTLFQSYVQNRQSKSEEARKALQGRMHLDRGQ